MCIAIQSIEAGKSRMCKEEYNLADMLGFMLVIRKSPLKLL